MARAPAPATWPWPPPSRWWASRTASEPGRRGLPSCFDCSSLVQWAWRHAGADLPRASVDQFQALARSGLGDLRPGDLVFYDYHGTGRRPYRGINHVVMYVGDGRVVEASAPAREVRVTGLAAKGRPAGVGRPHPDLPAGGSTWRYEVRRLLGLVRTAGGTGGWAVERGGRVLALGDAPDLGPAPGAVVPRRVAAIAAVPGGRGYWVADPDGGVVAFGDAHFRGQLRSGRAGAPVVAMAPERSSASPYTSRPKAVPGLRPGPGTDRRADDGDTGQRRAPLDHRWHEPGTR